MTSDLGGTNGVSTAGMLMEGGSAAIVAFLTGLLPSHADVESVLRATARATGRTVRCVRRRSGPDPRPPAMAGEPGHAVVVELDRFDARFSWVPLLIPKIDSILGVWRSSRGCALIGAMRPRRQPVPVLPGCRRSSLPVPARRFAAFRGLYYEIMPADRLIEGALQIARWITRQPVSNPRYFRRVTTHELRAQVNALVEYGFAVEGLAAMSPDRIDCKVEPDGLPPLKQRLTAILAQP